MPLHLRTAERQCTLRHRRGGEGRGREKGYTTHLLPLKLLVTHVGDELCDMAWGVLVDASDVELRGLALDVEHNELNGVSGGVERCGGGQEA